MHYLRPLLSKDLDYVYLLTSTTSARDFDANLSKLFCLERFTENSNSNKNIFAWSLRSYKTTKPNELTDKRKKGAKETVVLRRWESIKG